MLLTVFERMLLLNILPREGDFTTLKIVRKLRETLSFSESEHKLWQPKNDNDGHVLWKIMDDDGNPIPQEKEINVGEKATDIIVEVLKRLDKEKKLTDEHYSLYEKFIGG